MFRKITTLTLSIFLLNACTSVVKDMADAHTIYPCTIGCGNANITPPKGHVYYEGRVMSLEEFNRITHQHLVIQ